MHSHKALRKLVISAFFLTQCFIAVRAANLRKTPIGALERSMSSAQVTPRLQQNFSILREWPPHAPSYDHLLHSFSPIDPQVPRFAGPSAEINHSRHVDGQMGFSESPASSRFLRDVSSSRIPDEIPSSSLPSQIEQSTGPNNLETPPPENASGVEVLRMPAIETLPLWAQRMIFTRKENVSRDHYRRRMEAIVLALQSAPDNVRLLRNKDGSGRLYPHPSGETNRQYLNLDSVRRLVPKSESHRIPSPGPFLPTRVNKEAVRPKDAEEHRLFSQLAQMRPAERAKMGQPDDIMLLRDPRGFFVRHPDGITNAEYYAVHRNKVKARQRRLRAQKKPILQMLSSQSITPKALDAQNRLAQSRQRERMLRARYGQRQRLLQLAINGERVGAETTEASDNASASRTAEMLADQVAKNGWRPGENLPINDDMPVLRVDRGISRGKQGTHIAQERLKRGKQASFSTHPSNFANVAHESNRWPPDWILACVKRLKGYKSCYDRARFNLPEDPYMVWNRKLSQWESSGITNAEWLENRKEHMRSYNEIYKARKRLERDQAAATTVSSSSEMISPHW